MKYEIVKEIKYSAKPIKSFDVLEKAEEEVKKLNKNKKGLFYYIRINGGTL